MSMKIGIIGLGFVGLSLAVVLGSKGYHIIGIDSDKTKISKIISGKSPFYEPGLEKVLENAITKKFSVSSEISELKNCKLVFVAVGTPQLKNGKINLSMIKQVSKTIGKEMKYFKKNPIIIIKSTIIPGTTKNVIIPILEKESGKKVDKDFGVITNPEFLRESNAIEDTMNPHIVVLGSKKNNYRNYLKKIYKKNHPTVPIIETNNQTAEIIKYANNSFLATKISFINQIASICETISDANVQDVASAIGLDPRIGNLFLQAGPGYGGSCLPKDVKAMINFSKNQGVNSILFKAVEEVNQQQVKNIIKNIEKLLGKVKGKKITVLGISFKPFTDDIRDSVSIELINQLLKKNAVISIHDPKALEKTKWVYGDKITYSKSIKNSLKNSQCCVLLTPWPEYKKISNNEIKVMKKKILIDTQRMLFEKKLKVDYYALGIGGNKLQNL
jgi:UDPglucose 6-dehydrogenase